MTVALAAAIGAHLAEWDYEPVVELAIFGTADSDVIAARITELCRARLGAAVGACLFYQTSVGCVAGVVLDDGWRVVVKVHQPHTRTARLRACQAVQRGLIAAGFPSPTPLLEPTPLANGLCTVESYEQRGIRRDAHDPQTRCEIAARLYELIARADASDASALGASWFTELGPRLWPTPHSPLFDFQATTEGAEWIDELARRARRTTPAGRRVVAHFDWRTEHLLFEGDRIATVYDWDSLHLDYEPIAVGAAAHAFTAQWDNDAVPPAPSGEEILAFIEDYERARGRPFDREERHACHASCVYSLAYTSRCGHCLDPHERDPRTSAFRCTLREAGARLLDPCT